MPKPTAPALPGVCLVRLKIDAQVRAQIVRADTSDPALEIRVWKRSPSEFDETAFHPTSDGFEVPLYLARHLLEQLAKVVPGERMDASPALAAPGGRIVPLAPLAGGAEG